MAEERMAQVPDYVRLFKQAFGVDRPTYHLALRAIATFERAEVISDDSPFDLEMSGQRSAMSAEARLGMALFTGKAGCIQYHNGALFTDEGFHNVGVPTSPTFDTDILAQIALRYQHYARGVPAELYRKADRDLGLYYTTKREVDKGKFRTPPLRYLVYTTPYMHNGFLKPRSGTVSLPTQRSRNRSIISSCGSAREQHVKAAIDGEPQLSDDQQ